ncbi:hypothetical protein H632_c15p1 [Helicosporidium sp. ATCC 50920]|nr:hypothetical protein H632_c15p1 [Helicosporidium sp. ATCC 50920]|eukprot:KDD77118.1 hypothetical protein H632_c15p1 [Helicosporidium sp. ATCC 50920]
MSVSPALQPVWTAFASNFAAAAKLDPSLAAEAAAFGPCSVSLPNFSDLRAVLRATDVCGELPHASDVHWLQGVAGIAENAAQQLLDAAFEASSEEDVAALHEFAAEAESGIVSLLEVSARYSKAMSKLALIVTAIFSTLATAGFCRQEGDEGDVEDDGRTEEKSGTGMGDGDTSQAKDVTDTLDDQDQLLKGDQKAEENTNQADAPDNKPKGVEMDDDFEGNLENVSQKSEDSDDDESDANDQQLDEQMGDVGDAGENVDERMDREKADKKEEAGKDDAVLDVESAKDAEYAPGSEDQAEDSKHQDAHKDETAPPEPEEMPGLEGDDELQDAVEDDPNLADHSLQIEDEKPFELPEDMDVGDLGSDQEEEANKAEEEAGPNSEDEALGKEDIADQDGDANDEEDDEKDETEREEHTAIAGEIEDAGDDAQAEEEGPMAQDEEPAEQAEAEGQTHAFTRGMKSTQAAEGDENAGTDDAQAAAEDNAAQSGANAQQGGEATGEGATSATQGTASQRKEESGAQGKSHNAPNETNPYRSLGSALEDWMRKLSIVADTEPEGGADLAEADPSAEPAAEDADYRFEHETEQDGSKQRQVLASATEEQAGMKTEENEVLPDALDEQQDDAPKVKSQPLQATATAKQDASALERRQREDTADAEPVGEEAAGAEEEGALAMEDIPAGPEAVAEGHLPAEVALRAMDEEEEVEDAARPPPVESAREMRLHESLADVSGAEKWRESEAAVSSFVGELTEQLRLILEPTLASKLAGEHRSGKRINMRRVIAYIASQFKKDKIWLRRTQPDKRKYQVVLAVDNSLSMSDMNCAPFALQALALIAKSMVRLEVGEVGIVGFGGRAGPSFLHSLDRPFTDADGVRVFSQLRFDEDNTVADRPVEDLLAALDGTLADAQMRFAAGMHTSLRQLVLIIADGRFHEKESLRRVLRRVTSQSGVLYAFIVVDNPANSLASTQTVRFVDGKPVFTKYMDSFPFPFYVIVRDTASLPRVLADLLRQWFALSMNGGI